MSISLRVDDAHSLEHRIHFVLSRNPYLSGRRVNYEVVDSEVILRGTVRTYYQKQMAQESLRKVHGLRRVHNELCVSEI